jgi:hypothetical protein
MFKFFKSDPVKALEVKRNKMLEEAMLLQRSGDLRSYAAKIVEIETIEQALEKIRQQSPSSK